MAKSNRLLQNWIDGYLQYTSFGEAPKRMRFWTAVSVIAGALERKVWIDQIYFRWWANFYIVLVAPPGVVSKSTTSSVGMDLLRQMPGVTFGPDIVSWQKLATDFADSTRGIDMGNGELLIQSAMTIDSAELGNFLDPRNKEMVNLLISLWDGKQGNFQKKTKMSGDDSIENPWINMIGCTTPSWIAENVPESIIGGGFISRCVFVYADKKAQLVAYPSMLIKKVGGLDKLKEMLIADLLAIHEMKGEFQLTDEATDWGIKWYEQHNSQIPMNLTDPRFSGYLARKQTLIHKLAMILSAARSDDLVIEKEDLVNANLMATDLEPDMKFVFARIGLSQLSEKTERFLSLIRSAGEKGILFEEAYQKMYKEFPSSREFQDVIAGLLNSGNISLIQTGGQKFLKAKKKAETSTQ